MVFAMFACGGGGGNTPPAPQPSNNTVPVVTSLAPSSVTAGAGATNVVINGSGFISSSSVQWGTTVHTSTLLSGTQIQVSLSASDVSSGGTAAVTVTNPAPGGGTSTALTFTVNNPSPTVSAISPSSTMIGSPAISITVTGTGFMSGSVVSINGSARSTTFSSSTSLQAALTVADFQSTGTLQVAVQNPTPGGGTSGTTGLIVTNPVPTVSSISPTTVLVGSAASDVTLTGSGFVSSSVVSVNGTSRTTTYVSSTTLKAALTAADYQTAGVPQITVSNPSPGGGTCPAWTGLAITNPLPVLQSLSPSTATAGSSQTLVTLNGTGFLANSAVKVNGLIRAANYVSSTQLTMTLSSTELANPASIQITVANSGPGGGTSSGVNFSVTGAPTPITIISMSPSLVPSGFGDFDIFVRASGITYNTQASWNGSTRVTYGINPLNGYLFVSINASDVLTAGSAQIVLFDSVTGASSAPKAFAIVPMAILSVSPTTIYGGSSDTVLDVSGGGFAAGSIVQWNGAPLATTFVSANELKATVPTANLTTAGDASVTVLNPDSTVSNAYAVSVIPNPVPIVYSLNPISAPIGSGPLSLTIQGSGFTSNSVVKMNGVVVPSTFNSYQLIVNLPAQQLQTFGNFTFTVTNPAPGGGTSAPLSFSTYLGLQTNDLIYDSWSGLIYASTPSNAGSLGNRVVGIDPSTGNVVASVFVGSEPNKLALSSDGKTLWVGVDGAGSVRKVDLVTMTAGLQFGLGGGAGVYNPPATAHELAVMPGAPDTLAVSGSSSFVSIFDSGVARAKNFAASSAAIAFDPSGTKLYAYDGNFNTLTIDPTGVASSTRVIENAYSTLIRYDNGRIYTTTGAILDSSNGALLGTLYSGANPAVGLPAPDSANGKVFVLSQPWSSSPTIMAFDSTAFTSLGSISVSGVNSSTSSVSSLIRWGQNGLAFRTPTQVFILQSNLVKDLSATPADLNVIVTGDASLTTGSTATYTATVTNNGPNSAHSVVLINTLPNGTTPVGIVTPQGNCANGMVARCDLGTLLSGASVQVVITATVNTAGTLSNSASVSAAEPDPNTLDNTATATTVTTGADYSAPPVLNFVSPNFVVAGGSSFTLTVNGANYNSGSTIRWNGVNLATSFTDANTLTATVNSSNIASLGYAWVDVTTPAPGGGSTAAVPVTFYTVLGVDVTKMVYEPFSQKIYASVPSAATQLSGNTVVAIDPKTGSFPTPVFVGSQPTKLALSDDGNYLFIGLDGSNSITRFNLTTNATDLTFPVGTDNFGTTLTARGISVAPGNSNLLAVDFGSWPGNGLIDISGSTATRRANFTGPYTGSSIKFADATHVYTFDSDTSGSEFYRWNVTPTGLTQIDATTLNGMGGFSGAFQFLKGTIFGNSGGIANPSTTPPSMIGQFTVYSAAGAAADPWIGRSFFLGCPISYCFNASTLMAFDQSSYVQTDSMTISTNNQSDNLLRWGNDGLAFRSTPGYPNTGGTQVIILRGPFVIPQLGVANATGSISTLSPNSATAGATNFYMTVTGTGFVPGAIAKWNGADRTTYVVDSTHLSVAIPRSDVAASGTATVTVLNPGATSPTSALTFTIN
jgi:trimeric autotransporter adhesin